MIPHKKNKIVTALFTRLGKRLLEANFARLSLTPSSVLPRFEKGVPVVAVANHASWWDALLVIYFSYFVFKHEYYGIFAEEELERYDIFRLVGCFSVKRDASENFRAFLDYTTDLLRGRDRTLWLFPQGDLVSNDKPLEFKRGFAQIISHLDKVQLVKMTVSYDFWCERNPEIVVDLMPVETIEPGKGKEFIDGLTSRVNAEMSERLREVRRIVRERNHTGLKPLFIKEAGTNLLYDLYRRTKCFVRGEKFRKGHGGAQC